MLTWTDAILVSLLALGSAVLVGILGYLMEKSNEDKAGEEHK
jgi:hypothetical protein